MALTPAGEPAAAPCAVTLLNVEKIAIELGEFAQGVRGHVRMLANLSAIVEFLPEDLPGFFSSHDRLGFDLQERPSAGVVRGIDEGAADIGICSADVETRGLHTFPYRRDRLVIVAPADHPLTRRGNSSISPTRWSSTISACMQRVRSICARNTRRGRPARPSACASMSPASTPCAAWSRPEWASASSPTAPSRSSAKG